MFSDRLRSDVHAPPMKIQPAYHTTGVESTSMSQLRASERGEPADDLNDAQLYRALRIVLVMLIHEYAQEGEEHQPPRR